MMCLCRWQHTLTLEQELEVKADPLKRAHQRKISSFMHEVEAIIKTLDDQRDILEGLTDSLVFRDIESASSSPLNASSSMEASTITECICLISEKIEGLKDMTDLALQIGDDVCGLISPFVSLLQVR
jgi:hypothetical protein